MTATVSQRGYSFEAYASATHEGERLRDRKTFDTHRSATKWARQREAELKSGIIDSPEDVKRLDDLCIRTWEKFWADGRNGPTIQTHLKSILGFFGDKTHIRTLIPSRIDEWERHLREKKNSVSTINRKLSTLGKMLGWAKDMGWIDYAPKLTKYREPRGRLRYPSVEEEDRLVNLLQGYGYPDYADLVMFLADTGMRVSEALRLTPDSLTGSGKEARVKVRGGKTDKHRFVYLTQRAEGILVSRLEDGANPPFQNIIQTKLNYLWNKARRDMGLGDDKEFVPHALRHGVASRLIQSGVSLAAVKEILGHEKLETTLIYAHLSPKNLQDATEVLNSFRSTVN